MDPLKRPRFFFVLTPALLLALLLLTGCGLLNLSSLFSSDTSNTDYTGNYAFAGAPSTSGVTPSPVYGFVGAIANSGTQFTATFRLLAAIQCASPTQDVTFTGSSDSSGKITLTSTNLPSNTMSLTWYDDPAQSSNGGGSYTITGTGPCAMSSTNFVSDQFSPVTGNYTGSFTSGSGASATITAHLFQGAADADGQFPESGNLTLTTAACTNNFTLTGIVTGPALTAVFNQTTPGTLGGFAAILPDHALTLTIPSGINVLGSCNAGTFNGTLAKQ